MRETWLSAGTERDVDDDMDGDDDDDEDTDDGVEGVELTAVYGAVEVDDSSICLPKRGMNESID